MVHGHQGYIEACLKKPILIVGWGSAERQLWSSSPYANAHMHLSPGYLDAKTEDPMWFGRYTGDDLPGYDYDGLGMEGSVSSDCRPEHPLHLDGMGYKESSRIKTRRILRMAKTIQRLEKRGEKWRDTQVGDKRYGNEAEIREFYHALNAQNVWVWEGGGRKEGRFLDIDDAIKWIFKKADDLALQCRIITGKHEGEIIAFTSAPEDYDHGFSATTVAWLPYTDPRGRRYRKISLEGRDWLWQLGRNFSGMFNLLQEHEFEKLIPLLKPWEGDDDEKTENTTDDRELQPSES